MESAFEKWARIRHLSEIENGRYKSVWSQAWDAALEKCRKELIANGEHQAVEVIRKLQEKP